METTSPTDLPAMPECVSKMQDTFRRDGMFVQTHCIVRWVLADQEGSPLFTDECSTFICRSDDGVALIQPLKS